MTSYRDDPAFTEVWDAHHRRMLDLAFRILFDLRESEDVVQEAFTRLARTGIEQHRGPRGLAGRRHERLCLDRLRARRRRPTDPLDVVDGSLRSARSRPVESGDPRRQRHVGDACAARAVEPGGANLVRAPRRVPVHLRRHRHDRRANTRRVPAAGQPGAPTLRAESAVGRFPVDSALQQEISERFIEACTGGDLDGLLALLDPTVEGAGDVDPVVAVGAAEVAPGILRYLGPHAAPTLLYLPVGDRVGIVALRDRRVLALILLTIDNGLVVHVDALAVAVRAPQ